MNKLTTIIFVHFVALAAQAWTPQDASDHLLRQVLENRFSCEARSYTAVSLAELNQRQPQEVKTIDAELVKARAATALVQNEKRYIQVQDDLLTIKFLNQDTAISEAKGLIVSIVLNKKDNKIVGLKTMDINHVDRQANLKSVPADELMVTEVHNCYVEL